MKVTPLKKQSKKNQRKFHTAKRGTWNGVSPVTRREFWTHINALVDKGVTVLITTHFMDEAELLSCSLFCEAKNFEHLLLDIILMDTDGSAAELGTV